MDHGGESHRGIVPEAAERRFCEVARGGGGKATGQGELWTVSPGPVTEQELPVTGTQPLTFLQVCRPFKLLLSLV
jgi:hypothetical protein